MLCKLHTQPLLQPFHELFRKGVTWEWTDECEQVFVPSKPQLTAGTVLVPYDKKWNLILACDTPPYGVRTVISHEMDVGEEHPIAFPQEPSLR